MAAPQGEQPGKVRGQREPACHARAIVAHRGRAPLRPSELSDDTAETRRCTCRIRTGCATPCCLDRRPAISDQDPSRRGLLAAFAAASGGVAADALAQPEAAARGLLLAGNASPCVRDRDQLKTVAAKSGDVFFLLEDGRFGLFALRTGALPDGDALEGLFVAAAVPGHHWARLWDGVTGRAEWFGARTGDPGVDCRPAIEAALVLCGHVRLGPGDYHCHDTLVSRLPGRKLMGSGIHYAGPATLATRILVRGGRADVFRMGPDRPPIGPNGEVRINALNLDMLVEGIEFDRTESPDTDARPCGVVVQHCQDPVVRRVKSQDSIVDFAWKGTINLLMEDCRATRARSGVGVRADAHIGYYAVTGVPELTAINGNASARLVRCIASCTLAVADSTGLLLDERFTDHSVVAFETAGLAVGIRIMGDGATANGGADPLVRRNANVEIVRPWIDQFASVGLRIDNLDRYGIVRVSGGYFGPSAPATACIYVLGCRGAVLIGGEVEITMAATVGGACRGVLAIGTRRLLIGEGVTVTEASFRAFDLSGVADVRHMGATINEEVMLQRHTLIADAVGCVLRPALSGAAGRVVRGIEVTGRAASCTIDPAALSWTALAGADEATRRASLVVVDGQPQGTGVFGAGSRVIG